MSEQPTKRLDLKAIALLQQIAYLLSEGHDITVIVGVQVPGDKPKVVLQGAPKAIMRLSSRLDAEVDILLGKTTLVEIVSEAELIDVQFEEIEDG